MAFTDNQKDADILYGESPARIELAGTVKKGDAVGYSSGWKRALATAGSVIQMRCVAGEDGVTGQEIVAYFSTTLVGGQRFSGASAHGAVYVAEGTDNGKYTQTLPVTSGDAITIVGYSISATALVLIPNQNADATA